MRILLLISGMNVGGAETHVFELAGALSQRGHSVTVASSGGRLADELVGFGITHELLPLDRRDALSLLRSKRGLRRLIRGGGFDLVHAHSRICAYLARDACKRAGVPMITTVHAHFRKNAFFDRAARWGSGVIAVSYDLYRYVQRVGRCLPTERICVIPNGINTFRFVPTENAHVGLRVAFLSRLDGDCSRAAYCLCRIAEQLFRRYGEISIIIGGGGSEHGKIFELAKDVNLRLGHKVIYVCGNVNDSAQLLKNADVFVGVSRAALEAMSCGIPVVLAGDEGFLGVLGEGNIEHAESTNFCCRGCSAVEDNELFSALIKILDAPKAARKSIGAWLREYVVKTHSVAIMAEQTEQFYSGFLTCLGRENDGVLLCGYYGFGNMGDDLLLNGAIKYARKKYGNIALCALTKNGKKDSDRFGVKCVFRSNIFAVAKEIKRAKYVVFGGGTLLQNSTSLRSLIYYLFILKYAQKKKKPTELWGNGIGNVKGRLWRKKTAEILCECHFVGLRDKASLLEAAQLLGEFSGAAPPLSLESDISHLADVSGGNIEKHVLKLFGGHCRFALIAPRGVEKKGQTESLVAWCEHLHASGIGIVVVPMYPAQDLDICNWLARRFSGKLAYPLTLAELCALVKRAELVCSMRYHGLVLAANAGTPFIGFGAEEKVKSFCAENGGVYFSDIDE